MQAVKIHDILCLVIPKGRPILYLEIEVKIKKVAIFRGAEQHRDLLI
jgi:hypothetical protein